MYVIGSLDIGGTEKQLYLLLKYLDRDRFEPLVVSLSPEGYWTDPIRALDVELIELKRQKRFEVKRLLTLIRMIRQREPDIIHGLQSPGNTYGVLASILAQQGKTIASRRSFHNVTLHPLINKLVDTLVYRRVDAVLCNSRFLKEDLKARYGNRINGITIYNGIEWDPTFAAENSEKLKSELGLPLDARVIGTVGRLVGFKNHRMFLEIAREVLKAKPDTCFLLVGGGPLEDELRDYAKRLGIAERVVFTGKRGDVGKLLHVFDVFLFTSFRSADEGEGLSNAVMEAMLCGVPCVVSNVSGAEELFNEGEAGYLVDPTQKDVFIEKTLALLNDDASRHEMGQKGKTIIQEKLSVQNMAKQHERLYDSLLNKRPSAELGFT